MDELNELLKPSWGAEKWILEGWNEINDDEKKLIKQRMHALFEHGLPFKLKHDKLLYIYTFSLLAQLEVLAIQVPLKFGPKMSTVEYRERMRIQLLDEIFHGMVFTKIVYMLCAPNAVPPPYNANIEVLCDFIRNESCPKVALMLLNLIGEGWIEEIFYSLEREGIAPKIFRSILDDEHRHVCEADLYQDIGLPDMSLVKTKLDFLEGQLLTNIFMQYKYMFSVTSLLGIHGATDFIGSLNRKHLQQLDKIQLKPSENWQFFMKFSQELLPEIQTFSQKHHEVAMSPTRKVFMTQWNNPGDPTMMGKFTIDVSCLDFFNKKFPAETVTTLMMQSVSQLVHSRDDFRSFLSLNKLYQTKEAYVGIVVKLPDCGDHLGTIVFENCHELTARELSYRIRTIMKMMVYCYKKREQLEALHPHFSKIMDKTLYDFANDTYGYPIAGNPFISVSNIGFCGFTDCMSPLRINEPLKFTLLEIEKRQVFNHDTNAFEVKDILPVSISADHRIFDANTPVPKTTAKYFATMFAKMLDDEALSITSERAASFAGQDARMVKFLEKILEQNVELGYKALLLLQTYWFDFLFLDDVLNNQLVKDAQSYYEKHPLTTN